MDLSQNEKMMSLLDIANETGIDYTILIKAESVGYFSADQTVDGTPMYSPETAESIVNKKDEIIKTVEELPTLLKLEDVANYTHINIETLQEAEATKMIVPDRVIGDTRYYSKDTAEWIRMSKPTILLCCEVVPESEIDLNNDDLDEEEIEYEDYSEFMSSEDSDYVNEENEEADQEQAEVDAEGIVEDFEEDKEKKKDKKKRNSKKGGITGIKAEEQVADETTAFILQTAYMEMRNGYNSGDIPHSDEYYEQQSSGYSESGQPYENYDSGSGPAFDTSSASGEGYGEGSSTEKYDGGGSESHDSDGGSSSSDHYEETGEAEFVATKATQQAEIDRLREQFIQSNNDYRNRVDAAEAEYRRTTEELHSGSYEKARTTDIEQRYNEAISAAYDHESAERKELYDSYESGKITLDEYTLENSRISDERTAQVRELEFERTKEISGISREIAEMSAQAKKDYQISVSAASVQRQYENSYALNDVKSDHFENEKRVEIMQFNNRATYEGLAVALTTAAIYGKDMVYADTIDVSGIVSLDKVSTKSLNALASNPAAVNEVYQSYREVVYGAKNYSSSGYSVDSQNYGYAAAGAASGAGRSNNQSGGYNPYQSSGGYNPYQSSGGYSPYQSSGGHSPYQSSGGGHYNPYQSSGAGNGRSGFSGAATVPVGSTEQRQQNTSGAAAGAVVGAAAGVAAAGAVFQQMSSKYSPTPHAPYNPYQQYQGYGYAPNQTRGTGTAPSPSQNQAKGQIIGANGKPVQPMPLVGGGVLMPNGTVVRSANTALPYAIAGAGGGWSNNAAGNGGRGEKGSDSDAEGEKSKTKLFSAYNPDKKMKSQVIRLGGEVGMMGMSTIAKSTDMGKGFDKVKTAVHTYRKIAIMPIAVAAGPFRGHADTVALRENAMLSASRISASMVGDLYNFGEKNGLKGVTNNELFTNNIYGKDGRFKGTRAGRIQNDLLKQISEDKNGKFATLQAKLREKGVTLGPGGSLNGVDLKALMKDKDFMNGLSGSEKSMMSALTKTGNIKFAETRKNVNALNSMYGNVYAHSAGLQGLFGGKKFKNLSAKEIGEIAKDENLLKKLIADGKITADDANLLRGMAKTKKAKENVDKADKSHRQHRSLIAISSAASVTIMTMMKNTDMGKGIATVAHTKKMVQQGIRLGGVTVRYTSRIMNRVGSIIGKPLYNHIGFIHAGVDKINGATMFVRSIPGRAKTFVVTQTKPGRAVNQRVTQLKAKFSEMKVRRTDKIFNRQTQIKKILAKPGEMIKRSPVGKLGSKVANSTIGRATGKVTHAVSAITAKVGNAFNRIVSRVTSVFSHVKGALISAAGYVILICVLEMIVATLLGTVSSTVTGATEDYFEDGSDPPVVVVLNELTDIENAWIEEMEGIANQSASDVYGAYGQSLDGIEIGEDHLTIKYTDGDGEYSSYTTNILQIISMGTVYVQQEFEPIEPFEDYCIAMWKISHKISTRKDWETAGETWQTTNKYDAVILDEPDICASISTIDSVTNEETITCTNVVYCGQKNSNMNFDDASEKLLEESNPDHKIVNWESQNRTITVDELIDGIGQSYGYTNDNGTTFLSASEYSDKSYEIQNGTLKYVYRSYDSTNYYKFHVYTYNPDGTLSDEYVTEVYSHSNVPNNDDFYYYDTGDLDHTDYKYNYDVLEADVSFECDGHCGGHASVEVTAKVATFEGTPTSTLFYLSDNYFKPNNSGSESLGISYDWDYYEYLYPSDENGNRTYFGGFYDVAAGVYTENGDAEWARSLYDQDWYELYGISLGGLSGTPLSQAEIDAILQELIDVWGYDTESDRYKVVKLALESVGRIPYYFGGRAKSMNYDECDFGEIISPDNKGRTQRGLDCSGFLDYLYWNITGTQIYAGAVDWYNSGENVGSAASVIPGDIFARPSAANTSGTGYHCGIVVRVVARTESEYVLGGYTDVPYYDVYFVDMPGAPSNNVVLSMKTYDVSWPINVDGTKFVSADDWLK